MPETTTDIVTGQLLAILGEAFDGPPHSWSYFTDNRPDAGLFGTLAKLNAPMASQPVGGTSIAAHVHHVAFALEASAAWIRGDRTQRNWDESWRVSVVDQAQWSALLGRLGQAYQDLRKTVETEPLTTVETFGGAVAALAHTAYHLGAIRQKTLMATG